MILITLGTFLGLFYLMQLISLFADIFVNNIKMTALYFFKRLIPFNNLKRTLTPYWDR